MTPPGDVDPPQPPQPSASTPSPHLTVDNHDDHAPRTPPQSPPNTSTAPRSMQRLASPMRHHKRERSIHREVKETLDARVEFLSDEVDGRTQHRVNQYVIQDEIGRGSYGSVHLATDQFGNEYAIKEFSKARLRKRAQSNILKRGPHRQLRRADPDAPLVPNSTGGSARAGEKDDALYLIREEVAIMKKLDHPNLVSLIEVLDNPEEDSLYMVLEMCKKGVVMKVGLDDDATPYDEETCRHWFRDLILGIEYLHSQGVIHRDIKPENLLLSDDDVLKVVDFGVSQMFEKPGDMKTAKSAGSPAFLPPELCGKHAEVSGTAADIWSMGVSLYCLRYGRIPFNRAGMMEMYDAIKSEQPHLPEDENPALVDLFGKLLEKDAEKRIEMAQLREHPWVTNGGSDPLLPTAENCAHHIEPPNELELNHAFTRKMNHLLYVMKVFQRFKTMRAKRQQQQQQEGGVAFNPAIEKAKAEEIEALLSERRRVLGRRSDDSDANGAASASPENGQAHDVNDHEPLFLGIGTGARDDFAMDEATPNIVADSPTAVSFDVYHRAYEEAVGKLQGSQTSSSRPTVYLTRFVNDMNQPDAVSASGGGDGGDRDGGGGGGGLAELVSKVSLERSEDA